MNLPYFLVLMIVLVPVVIQPHLKLPMPLLLFHVNHVMMVPQWSYFTDNPRMQKLLTAKAPEMTLCRDFMPV